MKILAISPRIPEIGKKGDQVPSFHRLTYLSRNHQIKLICFGDAIKDFEAKLKLESFGISVDLIQWNKSEAVTHMLRAIFNSELAFQCALFESASFKKAFQNRVFDFKPDAVYAVTIRVLRNIDPYSGPLFVDMIDSMALNFSRRIDMAGGLKRVMLKLEYFRVKGFEKSFAQRATRSFVVSSIDQKMIGSDKVGVIPLGVDGQQFFKEAESCRKPVIIFSGNMNYKPNVDAVLWFYHNCLHRLIYELPECHLVIAGGNPAAEILSLRQDKAVTVTGHVPSIAALINAARVSIAPMQSGSGMQNKILEAMACGVPVVTTSLGLGDIKAEVGNDLLVADTAQSFVDGVLSLLQSNELHSKIGNSGWYYVKHQHNWDVLNAEFEAQVIDALSD
jgi:glycosyltransferase involved in cell wall biosynthesis